MRRVCTHIVFTLALILLCGSLVPASPLPRVLLDVTLKGRTLPVLLESTAVKEAALIWARYGVDLRQTTADCSGREGAIPIQVVFADRPTDPLPDNALGSIEFQAEVPGSEIVMYPDAIAALVSTATVMERHEPEWPTLLRHVVLGRAMGRALAHEIGHFLLRSRSHSPLGLMRAHQSIADLIAPEQFRFTLSTTEIVRLSTVGISARK